MQREYEGILLVDKPEGLTSFTMVAKARRKLGVQKIGHLGTLDPFATGLLVLLIGRSYTKRAEEFVADDKEYLAKICLGYATDTYDPTGVETSRSEYIPTLAHIQEVISTFQGPQMQVPPMFSAKKIAGKRLYKLAREGKVVERVAVPIVLRIELISYAYPYIELTVHCSKGTYIRSLADDIGKALGSFGHLVALRRVRSGNFFLTDACSAESLQDPAIALDTYFLR